jgi:REP element-mobilizing transposase RayT
MSASMQRLVNLHRNTPGAPLWQRNYHERIVRDERAFDAIERYIENNPPKWLARRSM